MGNLIFILGIVGPAVAVAVALLVLVGFGVVNLARSFGGRQMAEATAGPATT